MRRAGGFLPVSTPAAAHHEYRTTINGEACSDNAAWLHQVDYEDDAYLPLPPPLTPAEKARQTRERKKAEAQAQSAAEARRERLQAKHRLHPKFGNTVAMNKERYMAMSVKDRKEWDAWSKEARAMLRRKGIRTLADDTATRPLHVHMGTFMGRLD